MSRPFNIKTFIHFIAFGMAATGALAQTMVASDAPPPPVPPASVARDAQGRATVRAIRLEEPLRVDGRLDETVYTLNQSVSDFVQQVPMEGTPATERTEAWVMFDGENLYIAA